MHLTVLNFLQEYAKQCYDDPALRDSVVVKAPHIFRQAFRVLDYLRQSSKGPAPRTSPQDDNYTRRSFVDMVTRLAAGPDSFGIIPDL